MVDRGIYRSEYPKHKHVAFLKRLGIKHILYLCQESYPETLEKELNSIGVDILPFGVEGNKEPCSEIPADVFTAALRVMLDPTHHPILVHCNKGKHRTGSLIGCFRKVCIYIYT
jgi:tyrosine-protein phosphatase SIW14